MTAIDRLTADDVRILRLEEGAVRGHTCKVVVVEPGAVDATELAPLRAHIEARLGHFPRLRRRLQPTPLGVANPAWVDDPNFDVRRHVVAHPVDREVDEGRLRAVVAELMAEQLDRERPLWRVDVVGPLADGGAALILRVHHCLADGMTMGRILARVILDSESLPPPSGPATTAPGPAAMLALGVRDRTLDLASGARRAARSAASTGAWRDAVETLSRLPGVLARDLRRGGGASPLDARAGPTRVVAFVSRPLEQLHRIAKAFGVDATINDVVLSAVAGGLRGWMDAEGTPVGNLRAKVPVSLHQPGEDAGASANRDSFMVVDLALDRTDPVERLLAISAATRDRKRHHDAAEIDALLHDLAHLSRSLERLAERWAMGPRVFAVNVSNVPGPRGELSVLGARVRAVHSLAEIANRHALRVAAFSAGGVVSFGLCADGGIVQNIDALRAGLEGELDALLARA